MCTRTCLITFDFEATRLNVLENELAIFVIRLHMVIMQEFYWQSNGVPIAGFQCQFIELQLQSLEIKIHAI